MNVTEYLETPGPARPQLAETTAPPLTSDRPAGDQATETALLEPVPASGVLGLIELILKNRPALHRLIRDPWLQADHIPRFLAISLAGFTLYGIAMTLVLGSSGVWPQLTAIEVWLEDSAAPLISFEAVSTRLPVIAPWLHGSFITLIAAYSLGLIAATGVCLPALYFYGLLSGVKLSLLDCVVHSLKAKATAAIALVGILPIYAALAMGVLIFGGSETVRNGTLLLGLILPFIAGLWGTRSLYVGFAMLADTLPCERQWRRACFLRRLVFSWSALYTAVTPLMIFTLWQALQ